jgi:hypothetical protein
LRVAERVRLLMARIMQEMICMLKELHNVKLLGDVYIVVL